MSNAVTRTALVAEYCFAGDARDTSGNAHHGVVHGAVLTTNRFGEADGAFLFDGVDDYIEVSPPPPLNGSALSVSAWARFDARDMTGWTNSIVAQDNGDDADQAHRIFQLSAFYGRIVWHQMVNARDPMCRRRVRPGEWSHVVAVYEHGTHRLYVNGVLHDEVENPLRASNTQPLHIGRKGTPEPHFFFKGAIDDVRVYNSALSEAEIDDLLHESAWTPPPPPPPLQGDPISGRWGNHGVVFLDLHLEDDNRLTGRIMGGRPDNMAAIATGWFDRTSGFFRLEGEAPDHRGGTLAPYSIRGMLDEDQLSVNPRYLDFSDNLVLTRAGASLRLTRDSIRSQLGALAYRMMRRFS